MRNVLGRPLPAGARGGAGRAAGGEAPFAVVRRGRCPTFFLSLACPPLQCALRSLSVSTGPRVFSIVALIRLCLGASQDCVRMGGASGLFYGPVVFDPLLIIAQVRGLAVTNGEPRAALTRLLAPDYRCAEPVLSQPRLPAAAHTRWALERLGRALAFAHLCALLRPDGA